MMITTSPEGGARFHPNGFASAGHPGAATAQVTGQPTNPSSMHGTKRLASCREELERSWQGGSQQDLNCVSNDRSSLLDDSLESNRQVKRRRILESKYSMEAMTDCSSVSGTRISPSNRPHHLQQQLLTRPQVKAGWYVGGLNALGNRHGKGATKHDDGTEYEGSYMNDLMEGPDGRYKFITMKHLVPNPRQNGSHLYRQVEKSFEGSFNSDMPHGVGTIITKTVDCAPQVLGSTPVDIRFTEIVYDFGMHKKQADGKAVGEGVRIIYTTTNVDNRSTLEKTCFRLYHGENTNVRVAPGYAAWMLQCMNVDFPAPSM